MYHGNWKCSKCGGVITELPFEPRGTQGLTCRDCYFKEKNGGTATPASTSSDQSDGSAIDDRDDVPPFDPDEMMAASEPVPDDPNSIGEPTKPGERKMFEGDWSCATCGGSITQLPFSPRNTENLRCLDCYKNSRS